MSSPRSPRQSRSARFRARLNASASSPELNPTTGTPISSLVTSSARSRGSTGRSRVIFGRKPASCVPSSAAGESRRPQSPVTPSRSPTECGATRPSASPASPRHVTPTSPRSSRRRSPDQRGSMRESERILLSHLTETASLEVLSAEGFATDQGCEVLSSEVVRAVVRWAIALYFESGRDVPITKLMIEETWGLELEQLDITIDDEHELEPIEWAIDDLRAAYAGKIAHDFATRMAVAVGEEAHAPDRVKVLLALSHELFAITRNLVSRRQEADAAQGLDMGVAGTS